MMFLITPCGCNGEPFPPGTPQRYPVYMDERLKHLFRELKFDFPLVAGLWEVTVGDRVLKATDTPISLGFEPKMVIEAKLLMLQVKPKAVKNPETSDSSDEEYFESVAAAAAADVEKQEAAAEATLPKSEDAKCVSLEVWYGHWRYMTVNWGRHRHFWRLMLSLSGLCRVQNHYLILKTMVHVVSGVGCVVDSDSPHSLSLHDGDRLIIQHLPSHQNITPLFIPSLVVAENALRISGFRYHTNTRERVRMGMGRVRIYEKSTPHIIHKEKEFPSIHTEYRKTSNEFSKNTSRSKRKSTPSRWGERKRRKTPLTKPHMWRHYNTSHLTHKTPKVRKSPDGLKGDHVKNYLQNPKSGKRCDERLHFRPIHDVDHGKYPVSPRKDKRQNKDFEALVENDKNHD